MRTWVATVLAGVVYALCTAVVALAHDDAHWIERNADYTSAIGQHCCGTKDCSRISADLVQEDGNVLTYLPTQQKFRRGTRGTYLSETDDWWICKGVRYSGFHSPQAICIFHPFRSQ